jgi:hypothetical protein
MVRKFIARAWAWAVLASIGALALWQLTSFERETDSEYPAVVRPTFSSHPPAAYRLAEPGDTLDKAALYVAAAGMVVCGLGYITTVRAGKSGLWPAGFAVMLGFAWNAATPWPTFDGWPGWNVRAAFDAQTPLITRCFLGLGVGGLLTLALSSFWRERNRLTRHWRFAREHDCAPLLVVSALLLGVRILLFPDPEPLGYWPRWAAIAGLLALNFVACRCCFAKRVRPSSVNAGARVEKETYASPPRLRIARTIRRVLTPLCCLALWAALVVAGRTAIWYHRPLDRLRTVVPGRIYISAMPTRSGLEIAQSRHHFKTIINVFNENTPQRSPRLPDELRFVRERNLNYVASPGDPELAEGFLDETLRLSQDPSAWPILVHCHGCMDRSPAWMGIYRFLVQKRPLIEILREIEGHRGLRPKAMVTLLYNRVLTERAPDRYSTDPVGRELLRNAQGVRELRGTEARAAIDAPARNARIPRTMR